MSGVQFPAGERCFSGGRVKQTTLKLVPDALVTGTRQMGLHWKLGLPSTGLTQEYVCDVSVLCQPIYSSRTNIAYYVSHIRQKAPFLGRELYSKKRPCD